MKYFDFTVDGKSKIEDVSSNYYFLHASVSCRKHWWSKVVRRNCSTVSYGQWKWDDDGSWCPDVIDKLMDGYRQTCARKKMGVFTWGG